MEELPQLSFFFVVNLYLEKVELGGSHRGDFTWRGDYCIYQKPYVAWFQLNQMINSYLFEDWKENNFFMWLHFYRCKNLFILCTQYFPTHAGSLRFILEEVGLIDQDKSTHFSSSNLSLILDFLCLAGNFPTSPLWLNWSRATFVFEMSKMPQWGWLLAVLWAPWFTYTLLLTLTLLKIEHCSIFTRSLNPFWSVLPFWYLFSFVFFSPSSTGLRAPGCSVSGFTCSEWEAIHGNLSWVEAERAYRLFCLWKNRQLGGTCLHPRKPCEGAAEGACVGTSCGIVLVKLWPCASLQSPVVSASAPAGLRILRWLDTPETGTFCSRKEAFSLFCFVQIGLFYQWLCGFYQWFSYLAVTSFLNAFGV